MTIKRVNKIKSDKMAKGCGFFFLQEFKLQQQKKHFGSCLPHNYATYMKYYDDDGERHDTLILIWENLPIGFSSRSRYAFRMFQP